MNEVMRVWMRDSTHYYTDLWLQKTKPWSFSFRLSFHWKSLFARKAPESVVRHSLREVCIAHEQSNASGKKNVPISLLVVLKTRCSTTHCLGCRGYLYLFIYLSLLNCVYRAPSTQNKQN